MNQFELPAEIVAKLEATPDDPRRLAQDKFAQLDEALRRYYPQKSQRAIGDIFNVSPSTVRNRVRKLGLE